MDEQANAQQWKEKYLRSLDALEEKERHWNQLEQVLRQGLVRLSLAADTSDPALGLLMDRLRQGLRQGIDEQALRSMLEEMAEPIRRLDQQRRQQATAPTPNRLLGMIIDRMEFPRGSAHQLIAMQKRLLADPTTPWEKLVDVFVNLMMALMHGEGRGGTSQDKRGLLGRLLPGRERGDEDGLALAQQVLQTALGSSTAEQQQDGFSHLRNKVMSSASQDELLNLAQEMAQLLRLEVGGAGQNPLQLLTGLLERIEVPAELMPELIHLKNRLAHPDAMGQIESIVAAIADLVGAIRQSLVSEKHEIERFLCQLTERLQELDEGFQHNLGQQREAYEDGRRLNLQMDEQMDGLSETVQQAQELSNLKSHIAVRLDAIRQHMSQFRLEQDRRLAAAEQQVQQLTERLQTMQQESTRLHERVREERNLAMVDPLTGVANRLAYNERLALEYARWKRYRHALVIAVWDIDYFKRINDSYGHQAGDKVLTVLAKLIQSKIRDTDFFARFGGEEFVMLMPETDMAGALHAAESLRQAVEACEFHFRGKRVPVTISCGLSEFQDDDHPEQVFERADQALYDAKQQGRNRCCQR